MKLRIAVCLISLTVASGTSASSGQELDIRPYEAAAECGARAPQIEVTVSGVTGQGILAVELYRPSKRHFLRKQSRIHRIRVPAAEGAQTVCFDIDGPGTFAVAAYHDIDADRHLARKWNGMPTEPFALSNNTPLRLAMPKFKDSAFNVGPEGAAIQLELRQ